MKFGNLKSDQGVAGTAVLLGLIVSLFVIGLLVMIFALMGGSLQNASFTQNVAATSVNESLARPTTAGITLTVGNAARNGVCGTLTNVLNGTNGVVIAAGNYTQGGSNGCTVTNATNVAQFGATWLYTYPYTYSADNSATDVINDTTTSIASVTTFFSLFIVIGSMVVLILLTVIIIVAIKSSGMLGGTA